MGYGGPVAATFTGAVAFTSSTTPAALGAGTTNNYAPAGLSAASRLRVGADITGSTLTGIAGGTDGNYLIITNAGPGDLTLEPENAGSAAANRFAMNGTQILAAAQSLAFLYDGPAARWTALGV